MPCTKARPDKFLPLRSDHPDVASVVTFPTSELLSCRWCGYKYWVNKK